MSDDPGDLYGLDPKDFVAARNDMAKRLRAAGDRPLATEVAKLKRPTAAAWAVNQLARHHRADLEELVRLGEELRAAQDQALSGTESADLRQAGRARRDAVSRLAGAAEALLDERGGAAGAHSGEVAATLEAASLDVGAGAAVLDGRLAEDLRPPSGFGVFDPLPAAETRPATRSEPTEAGEPARRALEEAEGVAAEARRRWEDRSAAARAAVDVVAERRRAVTDVESEVVRLEESLVDAQRRLRSVGRDAEAAEDAASRAEEAAARASADVRDADRRLAELGDGLPGGTSG